MKSRVFNCLSFILFLSYTGKVFADFNVQDVLKQLSYDHVKEYLSPKINGLCANHTNFYNESLGKQEQWAMKMSDSSSRYSDSALMGLTTHLGNFDECISVQDVKTDLGQFNGQHCVVTFLFPKATFPKIVDVRPVIDNPIIQGEKWRHHFKDHIALRMSYCIPSSCSPHEMVKGLRGFLDIELPELQVSVIIPDDYCHTKASVPLASEDWVMVSVLILLGLLVLSSTIYEYLKKEKCKKLLVSFSLISNGKKLLSTQLSEDKILSIDGMKLLAISWVVICHTWFHSVSVPSSNFVTTEEKLRDFHHMAITNGSLTADTFLCISGFLVSYLFLRRVKMRNNPFNAAFYYLHRYIRVVPSYAFVILLEATLLRYMSSGPLLTSTVKNMAQNCQRNWWTNLLFINNYVESSNMCISQSWYLAVDMQLFIISPVVLYALLKWPRKWNTLLLGSLVSASIFIPFIVSLAQGFSANFISGNSNNESNFLKYLYYGTHARFGPWIIGMIFGCIQFEAKDGSRLSKVKVFLAMILFKLIILASIEGAYPFYQSNRNQVNIGDALYNCTFRNIWAVGVGMVIYLCANEYAVGLNKLLSWNVFRPLSRLTFCVYLIQGSFLTIKALSIRTPQSTSTITLVPEFLGNVATSFLLAAVIFLFVESPIIAIETYLSDRRIEKDPEVTPISPSSNVTKSESLRESLTFVDTIFKEN